MVTKEQTLIILNNKIAQHRHFDHVVQLLNATIAALSIFFIFTSAMPIYLGVAFIIISLVLAYALRYLSWFMRGIPKLQKRYKNW